jgi:hypothetical protein
MELVKEAPCIAMERISQKHLRIDTVSKTLCCDGLPLWHDLTLCKRQFSIRYLHTRLWYRLGDGQ